MGFGHPDLRVLVVVCSIHVKSGKARSQIMSSKALVSIVTPVFNEVEVIEFVL